MKTLQLVYYCHIYGLCSNHILDIYLKERAKNNDIHYLFIKCMYQFFRDQL